MSLALIGALLGLLGASGAVLAVRSAPPLRPIRLQDRMAPYLGDAQPPSRLLAVPSASAAPFLVARRLFGPGLLELVGLLDRLVGGAPSVRRRLTGLGSAMTVEEFRIEQVLWGAGGMLLGALTGLGLGELTSHVNALFAVAACLGGLVLGVLGRDWWLSRALEAREQAMLAEFPVVADLLALAVVAGESAADALQRVCRLTRGQLAVELDSALAAARAGIPLTAALSELSDRTTLEPLTTFLQALIVALERGTPLADVLRAQAADLREAGKRSLLEAGGRKEIGMLVPVVFLVLPITVVFALYPGLLTLTSLAH